jgi:indolepyruvate ferredoxin oxidoreductase
MTAPAGRTFALADRYAATTGEILLSGLQALVRLPLDQRRADDAAGARTAVLISGYEGSPLGGYDKELLRQKDILDAAQIVVRPAVNEELAANAVLGSQLVSTLASRRVEGVVGIWYGKAPGLDRATDALRHGNLGGASPTGGVLALVGDDATAKSSTVPSASEIALAELGMPILSPADPADILRLGLHGIALSRFCGLWSGLKLATNVVDGVATVDLTQDRAIPDLAIRGHAAPACDIPGLGPIVLPDNEIAGRPYVHRVTARFLQPVLGQLEESLVGARPELARRYAVANGLNEVSGDPRARLGVVAAGLTFRDLQEALGHLGVTSESLGGSGIRLLKLGMVSPLDPTQIREFAAGLTDLVVVEEKRPFVETAIRSILYGRPGAPDVWGKTGPDDRPFLRSYADLPPQVIATALAPLLADRVGLQGAREWMSRKQEETHRRPLPLTPTARRVPYFCSGCPHNRSTRTPSGSLVAAGIGCHTLVVFMDPEQVGDVVGFTQMGGEGAAWIGIQPFVSQTHLVQNIGDGTYHHSGSLAVRASVAAGSNVTYRLLYNGAVAMTGGQDIVGGMPIPALAADLLAEGVVKVVVTTDDPSDYRGVSLPAGVTVRHRDELTHVLADLAAIPGVTAVIHEQECATELRRKRKRGLVGAPAVRAFINERVCEGCGDCGRTSNCLSVQPVDTPFGRKTRIHQASCNQDYSCFDGDCPSFLAVTPATSASTATSLSSAPDPSDLPEPVEREHRWPIGIRLMGIGGTGIVTTAQVLAVAATNAGLHVRGLDQLGLSQKAGAVVSDLRLHHTAFAGSNKIEPGECGVYLGADLLVAADPVNLELTNRQATLGIISTTKTPTGMMIADPAAAFPDVGALRDAIADRVLPESLFLDARALTERFLGSDQLANTFLLGVATQLGAWPIDPTHLEEALAQNGVAVAANIQAFRWGRAYAADPTSPAPVAHKAASDPPRGRGAAYRLLAGSGLPTDGELGALVVRLTDDLIAYQDADYARRFIRHLGEVHRRGSAATPERAGALTETVARHLHKLMAYKDEYEVARLSLDPALDDAVRAQFGANAAYAFRLHPPMLRALGVRSKVAVPAEVAKPAFTALYAARRLRGTRLDPFGRAEVRRVERALIEEYVAALARATAALTPRNADAVIALAALPDLVRGYERVKLANVSAYRRALTAALSALP